MREYQQGPIEPKNVLKARSISFSMMEGRPGQRPRGKGMGKVEVRVIHLTSDPRPRTTRPSQPLNWAGIPAQKIKQSHTGHVNSQQCPAVRASKTV
jgi:hypothetical protein